MQQQIQINGIYTMQCSRDSIHRIRTQHHGRPTQVLSTAFGKQQNTDFEILHHECT